MNGESSRIITKFLGDLEREKKKTLTVLFWESKEKHELMIRASMY